jgi:hypothetical protein
MMFTLRGADPAELVVDGGAVGTVTKRGADKALQAEESELADLFGIEMGTTESKTAVKRAKRAAPPAPPPPPAAPQPPKAARVAGSKTEPKTKPKAAKVVAKPRKSKVGAGNAGTIDNAELRARAIPEGVVEYWLGEGLLQPGSRAGTFDMTQEVASRIARFPLSPARKARRK